MKSKISLQSLVGFYSNLKLKLIGSNHSIKMYKMETTDNGRRPKREDDVKI